MILKFRMADIGDAEQYFNWSNDPLVRKNSFNTGSILYDDHIKWFGNKLESGDCFFYLFYNEDQVPVGQVRVDRQANDEIVIGLSIDKDYRGKGLGANMLELACDDYKANNGNEDIVAYIMKENIPSYSIFKKAGFNVIDEVTINNNLSYRLIK